MHIILGIALVLGILAAATALTVLAVARLRATRGKHGSSGALSHAVLGLDAIFDPGKRHMMKAVDTEARVSEEDDNSAPPKTYS